MRDFYEPLESRCTGTWTKSRMTRLLTMLGEEVEKSGIPGKSGIPSYAGPSQVLISLLRYRFWEWLMNNLLAQHVGNLV